MKLGIYRGIGCWLTIISFFCVLLIITLMFAVTK